MNKITVIGNLGRDPEMRYTPNGQSVTSFSVASTRRYTTTDGERKEETEWFRVNAWGRLADTCNQYLTKGQQVYVEGRLSSRLYQAQDGQTRVSLDIYLTDMQLLGRRGDGDGMGGDSYGAPVGTMRDGPQGYDDADDLPF